MNPTQGQCANDQGNLDNFPQASLGAKLGSEAGRAALPMAQAGTGGAVPAYTSWASTPASPIKLEGADVCLWDNELFQGLGSSHFAVTALINPRASRSVAAAFGGSAGNRFQRRGRGFKKSCLI